MKTILVVDAESGSSDSVEAILQRRGFRGIIATNAREALALIRQHRAIDLIISEMQLPDMDGLHFLTAVRAVAPGVPIIIVTNSGSIESYLHAVNLGVYEYLNKPVLPKELARIASIVLAGPRPTAPMREAS
ncbi:MAG: response regulator [Nitrospirota bacterium]